MYMKTYYLTKICVINTKNLWPVNVATEGWRDKMRIFKTSSKTTQMEIIFQQLNAIWL